MPTEKKASREVVENLIKNMRQFDGYIQKELKILKQRTETLGESWKDNQYKAFSNFIGELTESLNKDLKVMEEVTDDLERRLQIL